MTGITAYEVRPAPAGSSGTLSPRPNAGSPPPSRRRPRGRAMANWDETALPWRSSGPRLPAAADCSRIARMSMRFYFASTTMPFADRQNAGIAARRWVFDKTFRRSISLVQRGRAFRPDRALDGVAAAAQNRPAGRRPKSARRGGLVAGAGLWRRRRSLGVGRDGRHRETHRQPFGHHRFVDHFRGRRRGFRLRLGERWVATEDHENVPGAIKALLEKRRGGHGIAHLILPFRCQARPDHRQPLRHRRPDCVTIFAANVGDSGAAHAR